VLQEIQNLDSSVAFVSMSILVTEQALTIRRKSHISFASRTAILVSNNINAEFFKYLLRSCSRFA
jgi:hypothetical protein